MTRRGRRCCNPIRPSPCRSWSCRSFYRCRASSSQFPAPGPRRTTRPIRTRASIRRMARRACSRPARAIINAIQVYPYSDGALYQVYAAPGEITDIALEPGEQLVGSGPVAAGDTVRWIIGDTESGAGAGQARPYPAQADPAGSRHQPHHRHRPQDLSPRAALGRQDLYGGGVVALCRRPAHRVAPAERRRRCGDARSRPASTSTRSTSATASRATIRPGGRCGPSMTGGRCSSSSRPASARARCRRSG